MQPIGLVTLLAAAAAAPAEDPRATWVATILRELVRTQMSGFVLDLVKWTLLGAGIGLLAAVIGCVLFSRLGWYDVRVRFAGALRWSVFVVTTLIVSVLFALAGAWSGALSGSERVLSKSQLATEVFPKLADLIADGMAWVQWQGDEADATNSVNLSVVLEEFRAGKRELNVRQFLTQLDGLQEDSVTNAIARLEHSALERIPQLKGGPGETLLHQFLGQLGRLVVEKKVSSELKKYGADRVYYAIREQLSGEAAKAGNPETITRPEISKFLLHEGIVSGIMIPLRSTARAQQVPLIGIALLVMVVPPACVRLAKGRLHRNAQPPLAVPPPV